MSSAYWSRSEELTNIAFVWEPCISRSFHNEFLLRWFKWVLSLTQEARGHDTNRRIAIEQTVIHCTSRFILVEQVFIHCTSLVYGVLTRAFFLIHFESGGLNLNQHLVLDPIHCEKTELSVRQNHTDEHAVIVWLVFGMRSNSSSFLSLCLCTVEKFTNRPESEFLPITVCKLVRWTLFFVCPGLFQSWTTETPITKSDLAE